MKKVYFLIPEGTLLPGTLLGAMEIFEIANSYLLQTDKPHYYEIGIIGIRTRQSVFSSKFIIDMNVRDYRSVNPDLIIVPGLLFDDKINSNINLEIMQWMVEHYRRGTEVASLCTGAFFLASAGLLDGKDCSTHWQSEKDFLRLYPAVKLCREKVMTDCNGIYTAGGATSALNLILYLVEKHISREVALYCAKVMEIDIVRYSQAPYIIFSGLKDHSDQSILSMQIYLEDNLSEKVTIDSLALKFAMSRRNLIRRFIKATQITPALYIQKCKVEGAKRHLELTKETITEVMYSVGYTDQKSFRSIFKKITGLTPSEYKARFGIRNIE